MQKRPPYRWRGFGLLIALLALIAGCKLNNPPVVHSFDAITVNHLATFYWNVSDADNDVLTCTIDFGDGKQSRIPGCNWVRHASHRYQADGLYYAVLTVSDGSSQRERTLFVEIPNTPQNACPSPESTTQQLAATSNLAPQGVAFAADAAIVPGKLIVRTATGGLETLAAKAHELGVDAQSLSLPGWARINVPKGQERRYAETLVREGAVLYAQPVYRYRWLATEGPNDPYFSDQQAQYEQMHLLEGWARVENADLCWPIAAVVDSGVDFNHEDLGGRLLPGYDFSDDDLDASYDPTFEEDLRAHGTMVAGIVAAVTNNGIGVAGTTNNHAYVLPLKVFNRADSETIADAIKYAADAGAHLINLSLCITDAKSGHCADMTGNPDYYIENALKYAVGQGLIATAASGNFGDDYVGYPASSDYTIAVGSADAWGRRSSFSNYGDELDFVAPGEYVYSTAPQDDYYSGSGTSFATPHITGLLALYLGQHYRLEGELPSFDRAKACLRENTNQTTWNEETGYGIPQADQVLDENDPDCYP